MRFDKFIKRLEKAWNKDTSFCPKDWSEINPARGQCVVTALLVQELYGGDIMMCKAGKENHFFNRLPMGTLYDLTAKQFPTDVEFSEPRKRQRSSILQYKSVARRYNLLKRRFKNNG